MIAVSLHHRQGDFDLDVAFEAGPGVTALFGPSGAGKTSVIRAIAGLLRPSEARITFDGMIWNDTAKRILVPAAKRRIGYVFQEGLLFPHMNVRQNLDFGMWFTPKAERRMRFDDVVGLLGIGHLLAARPANLSGGEKSRVAIGRALLSSPRLLLMDEPLASLDEARKSEILPYLLTIRDHWKVLILYVSHAKSEVAQLADQVILMKEGKIIAKGPPSILGSGPISFG